MALYGYARVSSRDQNLARKLDALSAFGVEPSRVYADKASGKDFRRPAWRELTEALQPGDVLAVKSIDRLGRNYDEILEEWRRITKTKRCDVVVLDMPLLDTRAAHDAMGTFVADLVLQVLSYVAQAERDNIRQRQAEGIAAAQARGVRFGRPPKPKPKQFPAVLAAFERGELTRAAAARALKVSVTTFEKWSDEKRREQAEHPAALSD